jgi:hypothetical protein
MAEQSQHRISRPAAADLSTKQYYFVKSSAGKAALPTADGNANVLGVLQNDPQSGDAATICDLGRTQVVSNGTVEVDKLVSAANGGKAKEAAAGEYIQGIAITGDGGVDGAIIEIHLQPRGAVPAA